MYVAELQLVDFRSYRSAQLSFDPGVCVLLGPNGQGKTNLVEAMGYTAHLGSHRVAQDAPLVRRGADFAIIRTTVRHSLEHDGLLPAAATLPSEAPRPILIELEIAPGRVNRARINRAPVSRPREILGLLRTVLFAPEDLALVKGDPGERRRFLDDLLVTRAPRFAAVRAEYEKVVRQRSTLLKSLRQQRSPSALTSLDAWDHHLAAAGAELLLGRLRLVAKMSEPLCNAYEQVSDGQGAVSLEYRSALGSQLQADIAEDPDWGRAQLTARLLAAATEQRREELDRGVCLVGPHRDDLQLSIGDFPAKGYASHGESWSLALALRLASFDVLRRESGGDPVLLLDDVFAELDVGRRQRLAHLVADAEQVVVTAAVAEDVPAELGGNRLQVRTGQVKNAE